MRRIATLALTLSLVTLSASRAVGQEAAGGRSVGTAVVLAVVPGIIGVHGLGSYYAGDASHGTRHLVIGLGSLGVLLAGLGTCDSGWGVPSVWDSSCGGTSRALSTIGALGYVFNWSWSTVVAARDARAARAQGDVTATLGITLRPHPGRSGIPWRASVMSGGGPRVDVGVLVVAF